MRTGPKPGMKRRSRRGAAIVLAAIWLAGAAWLWPDRSARLFHPGRFATTGTARLPAGTYIAAVCCDPPAITVPGSVLSP